MIDRAIERLGFGRLMVALVAVGVGALLVVPALLAYGVYGRMGARGDTAPAPVTRTAFDPHHALTPPLVTVEKAWAFTENPDGRKYFSRHEYEDRIRGQIYRLGVMKVCIVWLERINRVDLTPADWERPLDVVDLVRVSNANKRQTYQAMCAEEMIP